MHFESHLPFKMHTIIFSLEKKYQKRKICLLPYLKLSDLLPDTHLFCYFGLAMLFARVKSKDINTIYEEI